MTNIRQETVISEDGQAIIDRDDIQKKLRQLDMYLLKVNRRMTQINGKINHLQDKHNNKSDSINQVMKGDHYEC